MMPMSWGYSHPTFGYDTLSPSGRTLKIGHGHAVLSTFLWIRGGVRVNDVRQVQCHGLSRANEAIPQRVAIAGYSWTQQQATPETAETASPGRRKAANKICGMEGISGNAEGDALSLATGSIVTSFTRANRITLGVSPAW